MKSLGKAAGNTKRTSDLLQLFACKGKPTVLIGEEPGRGGLGEAYCGKRGKQAKTEGAGDYIVYQTLLVARSQTTRFSAMQGGGGGLPPSAEKIKWRNGGSAGV